MVRELLSTGTRVSFKLEDVLSPGLDRIIDEVTPELSVAGEIMFLSDIGEEERGFAIVNVGGTMSPVVVPTDCIRVLSSSGKSGEAISQQREFVDH